MSRRLASGTSRRSLVSDTTQVLPSFFPPRQLLLSHQSSVLSKIIYIFFGFYANCNDRTRHDPELGQWLIRLMELQACKNFEIIMSFYLHRPIKTKIIFKVI